MVHNIGAIGVTPQVAQVWHVTTIIGRVVVAIPWNYLFMASGSNHTDNPTTQAAIAPPPLPPPRPAVVIRPGCTAADESLTILGHLQGLAAGWGGSGVLKLDTDRLETAALGADRMGDKETATQLRDFKERLSNIKDPDQAREAAQDFVPIVQRTWSLGMTCGGLNKHKSAKGLDSDR
jgi:hypothetical protein